MRAHRCRIVRLRRRRVVNAVTEIDAGRLRLFDHQHLVRTDAEAAVRQLFPLCGREGHALVDRVDDDEIIAGAMHFCEFEFHVLNYRPHQICAERTDARHSDLLQRIVSGR